jgi:superfamily II DNA or RNA helicase
MSDTNATVARNKKHGYWQAQGLVELELSHFQSALGAAEPAGQRRAFYRLAGYHGRTLHIHSGAMNHSDEALARVTLHNLLALHRAMMHMHRSAPELIPLPVALSQDDRDEFARDLVMRVLDESPQPLSVPEIVERVNHLDVLGNMRSKTIQKHLGDLVSAGHAAKGDTGYIRARRPYIELDLDGLSLRALAGAEAYDKMAAAGFRDLREVDDRLENFSQQFPSFTGLNDPEIAHLFTEATHMLLVTSAAEASTWDFQDLLHSPYPRPYQRDAFAAFRRGDYQAQIVEAPTGSGKTLIGLMCIQDWLRSLQAGQSILILVPTSNYQQQWLAELCYNPIGLRLTPEIVFAGASTQLDHFIRQTGDRPAILLVTYTALAQLGSGVGKGGFDRDSLQMFLQQSNAQYVILDEVHKVVEDMHSVTNDVTRLLIEWLRDGSLHGLVGFSGTANVYRKRFVDLNLDLVHRVPIDELVAAGFVAPFTEFGIPFAFSARERRVRELLGAYKEQLRAYFVLLGPGKLRQWFAALPLEERLAIGHDLLGMYRGRADWSEALAKRFAQWENGPAEKLNLIEARLVTILQTARAWSDTDLLTQAGADAAQFISLREELETVKQELLGLIYLPKSVARLQTDGFTETIDAAALKQIPATVRPKAAWTEAAKDILATTITGLYDGLSEWYLHVGEGRVATIKAVIEAERQAREVSGIIVFDTGRRIHWRPGLAIPGFQGVGGLFAEMLGDDRFTAMAALSSEMYFTYDEKNPLPQQIAVFIERSVMQGEVAEAIFNLLVRGINLPAGIEKQLEAKFEQRLAAYLPHLAHVHANRPGEFSRRVLNPLRRLVKKLDLGLDGQRLLSRLDRQNVHMARLVRTFFDFAMLARYFREAHVAELEQVSGARQKFFVVPMPGVSGRKQLMYDLTSRIVDAESLPINFIIVSNWARTGWNVIQPNLLIDATATHDVTAWQQLRGRAIRAWKSWTNDCYRLMTVLLGYRPELGMDGLPDHEVPAVAGAPTIVGELDEQLIALLNEFAPPRVRRQVVSDGVDSLTNDQRLKLAIALARHRNKVSHIYEMVKAYGSGSQVTFDRSAKAWRRRDAIAAKHAREIGVDPFSGTKVPGVAHAPLLYVDDPRTDLPSVQEEHVAESIKPVDKTVVGGWLGIRK